MPWRYLQRSKLFLSNPNIGLKKKNSTPKTKDFYMLHRNLIAEKNSTVQFFKKSGTMGQKQNYQYNVKKWYQNKYSS